MKTRYISFKIVFIIIVSSFNFSCEKLLEIDPPQTDLVTATVFRSDATANAAVQDIYFFIRNNGFVSGNSWGISFLGALYGDEMLNYSFSQFTQYQQFNDNMLQANNSVLTRLWSNSYTTIYKCNSVLEGLETSNNVSPAMKARLAGEGLFIRAMNYFYLVNLWGDVPLVLSTDYQVNNSISRSSKEIIYNQIIEDLKSAEEKLPADYSLYNNERVRANRAAASALLARVYLYQQEWDKAEHKANEVISQVSLYSIVNNLELVFSTTSQEAILQIWSPTLPNDQGNFFIYSFGPGGAAFRPEFVSSFEPDDKRWTTWGQAVDVQGTMYYGAVKYKSVVRPPENFATILRLAEQYLIRAEARAQLNKITGPNSAESDINLIRSRAGLDATSVATKEAMLLLIEQERLHELFTELGHRWFDIKRTGRAAEILTPIKPDWQSYKELFPIPEKQIINDPNVTQNPGY